MNPLRKISLNPNHKNSIKTRFTYNFLRALKQVNSKNTISTRSTSRSSASREITIRFHQVKYAANMSMAAAVGSKRAWSRAILRKMGRQRRSRVKSNNYMKIGKACNKKEGVEFDGEIETKELMKIVPGCEGMETGILLEETAHYIKCLTTQVQVMKQILHLYSS